MLTGEIINSAGTLKGRNDSLYYLHIRYQFTTPDGRTLARTQSRERTDLRFQPLPEIGLRVKVLYADDQAVVML